MGQFDEGSYGFEDLKSARIVSNRTRPRSQAAHARIFSGRSRPASAPPGFEVSGAIPTENELRCATILPKMNGFVRAAGGRT